MKWRARRGRWTLLERSRVTAIATGPIPHPLPPTPYPGPSGSLAQTSISLDCASVSTSLHLLIPLMEVAAPAAECHRQNSRRGASPCCCFPSGRAQAALLRGSDGARWEQCVVVRYDEVMPPQQLPQPSEIATLVPRSTCCYGCSQFGAKGGEHRE